MKVLIDVPDEVYKKIQDSNVDESLMIEPYKWIKNGTPLPKGHKVIDAFALQEHLALVPMEDRTYCEAVEIIDRFPSIIEADRSEEDGQRI